MIRNELVIIFSCHCKILQFRFWPPTTSVVFYCPDLGCRPSPPFVYSTKGLCKYYVIALGGGFGQNITIDYNLRGGPPSKLLQLKLWSNHIITKVHFFKRKQIGGIILNLMRQWSKSLISKKVIFHIGPWKGTV